MKTLLLTLLLTLGLVATSAAQKYEYRGRTIFPTDSATNRIGYVVMVPAEGLTAEQLAGRVKEWAKADKKNITQVRALEQTQPGRLVGTFATAGKYHLYRFLLTTDVREGRARLKLTDITYGPNSLPLDGWILPKGGRAVDRDYELLNADFLAVLDSLRAALVAPVDTF